MTQTATCVRMADRWLDEVILQASGGGLANVGVDDEYRISPPADEQDLAIMSCLILVTSVATMVASINDWGASLQVLSGAPSMVDLAGYGRFVKTTSTEAVCVIDPDALTLWQKGEVLSLTIPEIDTNVSPTADIFIRLKCVRVRPVSSAPLPIQLVR